MEENIERNISLHESNGFKYLLTNGPDLISQYLREGKAWESTTLYFSKELVRGLTSPVLVDIGANLGAWSVPMAAWVKGVKGCVLSFEPQRPVFYQLCANILCNDLINCHAYNLAIGSYNGIIEIPLLDIYSCANLGALSLYEDIREMQGWNKNFNEKENVRITTLDELQLPSAHLIKVDVEGLELEVVTGGKNWIKRSGNPPILLEVWGDYMKDMMPKKEKLLKFIKEDLGYNVDIKGELCICQHPDNVRMKIE